MRVNDQVGLNRETKKKLNGMKQMGSSYDDVIRYLIGAAERAESVVDEWPEDPEIPGPMAWEPEED